MVFSNTEKEIIWVDTWNDLYDLIEKYPGGYILLPDYIETDKEGAEGWIQNAAYESNRIVFKVEYFKGKESIFINKMEA
ncbi:hypothetical protein H0A36_09700 [Endozoicomonas sp. SM1973]|uniref:Uncharacterized protein n=1 Tax=Spartinivicinus marinus TaxID=2994442 RepID=A0A853IAL2_9GAMM|nr:hypothetical protein [Spartinivicinus marinus]MCX4024688.1 hypothetical protein [Spartinivicinus marinus]NYZ66285.1 hypothetical protein [Spartinivicinus marinus]